MAHDEFLETSFAQEIENFKGVIYDVKSILPISDKILFEAVICSNGLLVSKVWTFSTPFQFAAFAGVIAAKTERHTLKTIVLTQVGICSLTRFVRVSDFKIQFINYILLINKFLSLLLINTKSQVYYDKK